MSMFSKFATVTNIFLCIMTLAFGSVKEMGGGGSCLLPLEGGEGSILPLSFYSFYAMRMKLDWCSVDFKDVYFKLQHIEYNNVFGN